MNNICLKKIMACILTVVLLFSVSCGAEKGTEPAMKELEYEKKIDEYMNVLVSDDLFRGVVLISKDGEIIFEKPYGNASEEYDVLNTVDTKFEIGSLTKQFTAASVLLLAQQNKLAVTDKINQYIPDFPNGENITIHNLLAQNSGIADYVSEITSNPEFNYSKSYQPEELVMKIKSLPLSFQAGEKFEYSNSNYALLGYVVEKVSGKPWAQYVNENIIKPLGLKNTGFTDRLSVVKNLATGYTLGDVSVEKCYYEDGTFPYAAGQMYSNANDLAKWSDTLFSNKVLNKEYTAMMITKHVSAVPDSPSFYGYGLFLEEGNKEIVWHSGSIEGFTSDLIRYVDDKVNIVVLSNNDCTNIETIGLDVGHIYFNEEYTMPDPLNLKEVTAEEMDPYLGAYVSEDGEIKLQIVKENNSLYVVSDVVGKGKLFGRSKGNLYWKNQNYDLLFQDIKNNQYQKLSTLGGLPFNRVEE